VCLAVSEESNRARVGKDIFNEDFITRFLTLSQH
jgi:hypothetical protein